VINSRSASSAPAGYRFPREVIAVAVRWYLRYGLSYRDVEELLAERGIDVDHVTIYRWVQTLHLGVHRCRTPPSRQRLFVELTYGRCLAKARLRWSAGTLGQRLSAVRS
jgi:IS6 family transposase